MIKKLISVTFLAVLIGIGLPTQAKASDTIQHYTSLRNGYCNNFVVSTEYAPNVEFQANGCRDNSSTGQYRVSISGLNGDGYSSDVLLNKVEGQWEANISITNPGKFLISFYEVHPLSQDEWDAMSDADKDKYEPGDPIETVITDYKNFTVTAEQLQNAPASAAPANTPVLDQVFCDQKQGIQTAFGCLSIIDTNSVAVSLVNLGLSFGSLISLIIIGLSSFMVMTSQGDPRRLTQGKELMGAAIIGLLMLIFSGFLLKSIGVNILGLF